MLAEYFQSPLRIQELRDCPAGYLVEGFAQELYQAGYARLTARRHLRSAEHLVYWIARRGMSVTGLTERFVKKFSNHLNRCRCTGYGHTHRLELENGVRLFIRYLRRAGVLTAPINKGFIEEPTLLSSFGCWMREQRGTCDATLLSSFGCWMREQRGTCDATLYNYGLDLRVLLKDLGEDPARFNAQTLRNFVLERTQRCGWAAAGLERYLQTRRSFAPFDNHVFVSLRRRRLLVGDAETAFHQSIEKMGMPRGRGFPRPTIHSLRHSFAVKALETCPDGRDRNYKTHVGAVDLSGP